jgi:DNA processing protein
MIDDRVRTAALALRGGIGWKLLQRLLAHFGNLEGVLGASEDELRTVPGIGTTLARRIGRIDQFAIARDLRRLHLLGIQTTTWTDPAFPSALNALEDRPLVLFWRGAMEPEDEKAIAIVGTRHPTQASHELAQAWAAALAGNGQTIISGLARGIDAAAHRGALAGGGRSIAVLGGGVRRIYPPEHKALGLALAARGALVCETHPEASVSPGMLVYRNRIVAGLARALIVVEAGRESGALHAARRAHELGRPVFAVPNSDGNRDLLASFARPLPEDAAALLAQL